MLFGTSDCKMADEIIFDLLHNEIVGHLYRNATKEDQVNVPINTLDQVGDVVPVLWDLYTTLCMAYNIENPVAGLPYIALRKDQCIAKLESLGFRVGQSLVERFTKDCTRFKDELDTMKFICKDFWNSVFKKQVDNLRTNHQGVYVLQDNKFRFLTQISNGKQYMEAAPKFLAMACGMIRGALANIGVNSVVTAEVSAMPACKFQIQIQRS